MGNIRFARAGTMQFWPRKRAVRQYPRVRFWKPAKEAKLLGFAGYKVGMGHVMYIDNKKTSKTKGLTISCPVTILECPPLKIYGIRFYKKTDYGMKVSKDVMCKHDSINKELSRKLSLPAKANDSGIDKINPDEYSDMTLIAYTQPKLTNVGKKKPEIFEIGVGGSMKERFDYAKNHLGKEILINDVLKEGQVIDVHAVSKGKGFQGPVKRFGIAIRQHKAEKTKRGPGSLGGWRGQGHMMYRVAHAGQTGYHTRMEFNKWVMKIINDQKEIAKLNPQGGFNNYSIVKNPCVLIKGSVPGAKKRLVRFVNPLRDFASKESKEAPQIQSIIIN